MIQAILVAWYFLKLVTHKPTGTSSDFAPSAAVILCVRGCDPTLAECVKRVLQLDYSNFVFRIVADHAEDPALPVVRNLIQNQSDVDAQILILDKPEELTASLKCGALVHGIRSVLDEVEVVALIDADTFPHSSWLSELVAPFENSKVGASTGIRWYTPNEKLGTMVRSLWNAAAIVQMYCYKIAWGGSLAFRSEAIRKADLLEKWSKAFCEDTMTRSSIARCGYDVSVVPSLVMVSSENSTVEGFMRWVRRQLLTSRLYHPAWPLVLSHSISISIAVAVALIACLGFLVAGNFPAATLCGLSLLVFEAGNVGMLIAIEFATRVAAGERRALMRWINVRSIPIFFIGLVCIQVLYFVAALSALFMKEFDWRGIHYKVTSPWSIELKRYVPYKEIEHHEDQSL